MRSNEELLIIKSEVVINNNIRINKMVMNKMDSGEVHIKVTNGRVRATGEQRFANIRLDKNNLKRLREWLDNV